jgi:penicillin-binding protein 2
MPGKVLKIAISLSILFALVLLRLAYISLIDGENLQAMAENQHTRSFDYYQYSRGDFLDTLGRTITGVEEDCLVVFPAVLEDETSAAHELAQCLEVDDELMFDKLSGENSRELSPYILKTGLTLAESDAVKQLAIPGILVLPLAARYSSSYIAVHLLGMVLPAADAGYYGASGLEAQYDQYLSKRRDQQVIAYVDATGNLSEANLYLMQPEKTAYNDVQLTINLDYQQIAEQAMSQYSGACVILDPVNGDILAAVSSPAYDPYGWDELAAADVYVNKAFSLYPPASTFKIVLAAAALEHDIGPRPENQDGDVTANDNAVPDETATFDESEAAETASTPALKYPQEFSCDGAYTLAEGYDVSCWKAGGHGALHLSQALINSCNCYFVGLGLAEGGDLIKNYAARFGLTEQQIIGYELPDNQHIAFSSQIEGDIANASIGEKGVRISPLQSAVMMSVCVNGGYLVTPRLVKGIYTSGGMPIREYAADTGERTITAETAAALKQMLIAAVDSGTAAAAAGTYINAGGKTGTTEDYGVWFSGFAPAEQPRWVIAIYVANGSSGGKEAATVFHEIIDNLAVLEGID